MAYAAAKKRYVAELRPVMPIIIAIGLKQKPENAEVQELPGSAPDSSKGAPTDPDAPDSGIRFLVFTVSLPVTIRHCRVNTFVNDSEFIPCFPVAVP